ncbi:hypothetical protein [Streptomyces sp. CoH27]|uniref:hypothetical protein n=1 Tax=Streptomyces sp. CoH27 TaxID=2875763 RepID=UPI001CD3D318|nr:hypothetical protein [Streptomyces sp. CoH27]
MTARREPVRNLADADRAAARFAGHWGLHVGEVMRFSNGFWAQLLVSSGKGATEVLVDPGSSRVRLEFGPAMMWNTAYGMMPAGTRLGAAKIDSGQAVRIVGMLSVNAATGAVRYHSWHGRFLQIQKHGSST